MRFFTGYFSLTIVLALPFRIDAFAAPIEDEIEAGLCGHTEFFDQESDNSPRSNTVSFWMEGVDFAVPAAALPEVGGFQSCSRSERREIRYAARAAKSMASDAYDYLNGSIRSRYTTWFGSRNSSRQRRVQSNFSSIYNAVDSASYDCSCNQGYFAYVYPNRPYKIYLCNAFWRARTTGTDSQAGTIVHELSHFYVLPAPTIMLTVIAEQNAWPEIHPERQLTMPTTTNTSRRIHLGCDELISR